MCLFVYFFNSFGPKLKYIDTCALPKFFQCFPGLYDAFFVPLFWARFSHLRTCLFESSNVWTNGRRLQVANELFWWYFDEGHDHSAKGHLRTNIRLDVLLYLNSLCWLSSWSSVCSYIDARLKIFEDTDHSRWDSCVSALTRTHYALCIG